MTTLKKVNRISIPKNILLITYLFISVSFVQAQSADYDFTGNWKSEQGPLVQISKTGDTFRGVNAEIDKVVLEDLKFADDKWTAVLIKPQDGSRYDCTVTLQGDNLKFTIKKGLLSKTITWTKQ